MYILGKSAVKIEDIKAKANICEDIELQLFNEFESNNDSVDELFHIITSINNAKIRIVHSPIIQGEDVNLEFIDNEEDYFRLYKTVELAGKLSNYYNYPIKIVIHSAFRYENFFKIPSLLKKVEDFLNENLKKYDKIIFCIENVIPCKMSKTSEFYFRNGCLFDNVKLVKYLRTKLNTKRIGTVLDTCHMLVALNTFENILNEKYSDFLKNINMERYFEEHKDVIELIHLCDVKDLGYRKGTHGIKFEGDRIPLLINLIIFYTKYNYTCDITIEILEEDYIKNDNFKDNYGLLKLLLEYYQQ